MYCSKCGKENDDTAMFCSSCGNRLSAQELKEMEKREVTWGAALKVWWGYMWRFVLFSAILGALLGFIGGVVCALIGKSESAGAVGSILGSLGSIPVSLWVMKKILDKKFGEFSVALVRETDS